jgi:hypothetical protein
MAKFCGAMEIGVLPFIGRDNERGLYSRTITNDITGLLKWARFQNARQLAQIYVRPQPQTKHPWLFFDDVAKAMALRISQKYAAVVVETSKGNCQIRLLSSVELDSSERAMVQKNIAPKIMADRASTAGEKWGRLAGFQNRKPGKEGWWTTIVADTSQASHRFDPEPFMSETNWSKGQSGSGKISPQGDRVFSQNGCGNCSESEREFAWVVNRIKWFMEQRPDRLQGDLPAMIENLTQRARSRGKRHPEAYAERTVAAAIQRVNY